MDENSSESMPKGKPWHKKWWGVLLIILFWPISSIWAVWAKTKWPNVGKAVVTALIVIIVVAIGSADDSSTTKTKNDEQVAATKTAGVDKPKTETTKASSVNAQEAKAESTTTTRPRKPEKTLGISDNKALAKFNAIDTFKIEDSPLKDGRQRRLGQARTAMLELIGDPSDLEQITISVAVSNEDALSIVSAIGSLLMLPTLVDPTWDGASDWLNDAIERAVNGEESATTVNGVTYKLMAVKELGLLSLSASRE